MRTRSSLTNALWRHKASFGSIFLAGTLASYIIITSTPPSYSARAIIEFPQHVSLAKAINSIQSPENLRALIAQQNLENDARFNPDISDPFALDSNENGNFKSLNLLSSAKEHFTQQKQHTLLDRLRSGLRVKPLDAAGQIEISFTSRTPDLSAQISNGLAQLEIETAQHFTAGNAKIFSVLSDKIEAMQSRVSALDKEILEERATFARSNIEAEYSYTTKLSSLQNDIENLSSEKEKLSAAPQTSAKLTQLEQEKTALTSQQNKLAARYGHKHPKIVSLSKKLKTNSAAISDEKDAIQTAYLQTQQDIESRLAVLEIGLDSIAPAAGEQSDGALLFLEKQRKNHTSALQQLIAEQTQNAKALGQSLNIPALVLAATPNDTPISTNQPLFLALAMGFFAVLGLFPGGLFELRRRKFFQSTDDLQKETGRPCFGRLALVDTFDDKPVADYVLHQPHSQVSEAIKALRIQLKLRSPQTENGQVVMLTSALAHEGKTTTALWIARQAAQAGLHTILVDADLRSPGVHKALLADNTASIVDVLTGRRLLDQCIRKDLKTGLHVLMSSPAPSSAADLLSDTSFAVMMTSLRKNYDLIILDTHAALSVADSRAVAAHADQILFMVRWNETPRDFVHNTIEEISRFSTASIATVLAAVDVEEQVKLGYGDVICTLEAA